MIIQDKLNATNTESVMKCINLIHSNILLFNFSSFEVTSGLVYFNCNNRNIII